ncbi:MAG TPA: dihydrodipicolinate synthase family protein [Candidatus Limnocylindrales bacterium]|nr:dihydrodipicolinate synthase family protein [Candidatus Limnocylindrales bacterium]
MQLTELSHRPLVVAAVTPLSNDGVTLDEGAIGPYVSFLESHGADGVFACGTTGEGVLLSVEERRRAAKAFRSAVTGTLVVHAGAQTTADTTRLAGHAAEIGADAVAVIPPPYYGLTADELTDHFVAAARACAPLPFFCYAFTARSGNPLPIEVIRRIGESVDNLAGLKVSESPFDRVAPYLELGLPVLIGNEPLLADGIAKGALGTVSGLSAAFPDVVRAALDEADEPAMERLRTLRGAMEAGGQFIAALKYVLALRGVAVTAGMRAPLRSLTTDQGVDLEEAIGGFMQPALA